MKQHFFNMVLLASLGTVGVVLSQPELLSHASKLVGLQPAEKTVDTEFFDDGDEYDEYCCDSLAENSPYYAQSASISPPLPFAATEAVSVAVIPTYEEPATSPISTPTNDFGFADISAPLTEKTVEIAASSAVTAEPEGDFSAFNQNFTQETQPADSVITPIIAAPAIAQTQRRSIAVPQEENLEETVLYEPPQTEPLQTEHSLPIATAPIANDLNNTNKPAHFIAVPPENYTLVSNDTVRNPLSPDLPSNNIIAANTQYPPLTNFAEQTFDQRLHVDPNLVEIVPCPGAETVARVGTEVILGCDILPEAKKVAYFEIQHKLESLSPEDRAKVTPQQLQEEQEAIVKQVFPMILDQYVRYTLLYCDFASGRKKEEIQMWEKRLGDSFEESEVPKLMKQFGVENRMDLNNALENLIGSSIDREKALFVRKTFGQIMIGGAIKEAEGECTHDEMLTYYNDNKAEFFHKSRAKWLQLTVNVTANLSTDQAKDKIVWMGNQVAGGIQFERVARDHSDGLTAKNGGFNDWVNKGALVSDALENAIFQSPVGALSPIIQDRNAFHIVKVLDREEEFYTPFLKAQTDIKKKIKEQRRNKKETEYFAELFRKFHPETYQNNVANFTKPEVKVSLPQGNGVSLHGLQ